jgi:hypothetical protein
MSLTFSAFSLIDFILHLTYFLFLLVIGACINLGYLLVNNFLGHTIAMGFITHIIILIMALPIAPFDHSACHRLNLGLMGLSHCFYSLFQIIKIVLLHPFSCLLGTYCLKLISLTEGKKLPIEEQYLEYQKTFNAKVAYVECNLVIAGGVYLGDLKGRLSDFFQYLMCFISTPIFILSDIGIWCSTLLCSSTKICMTIPLSSRYITHLFLNPYSGKADAPILISQIKSSP